MSSLDSFFRTVKLPSISEVARDLIKTLNDPDVSVVAVRNILARDPALTAQLLRVANSAQFGLPRGVGTLDEAITMVGMAQVRSLSLAACLSGAFPTLPGLDRSAFWKNSMACAGYAQWLAGELKVDTQTAWLTGMMLRLGELLIGMAEPKTLQAIEKPPLKPGERWAREQRLVGFTEGQVTAELARRWDFPMQIVQALQRSSDPLTDQAFSRLGAAVHLAALLADAPQEGPHALDTLPPAVVTALELDVLWMRNSFPQSQNFPDLQVA